MNDKERLSRAGKALLAMQSKNGPRPKIPTKADLNRKFVLRIDQKGKPCLIEK